MSSSTITMFTFNPKARAAAPEAKDEKAKGEAKKEGGEEAKS